MFKLSSYPMTIELEIKNDLGEWVVEYTSIVTSKSSLYKKMIYIKTMYVLEEREYRVFIRVKS